MENSSRRRVSTYAAVILFAGSFGWIAEVIYHVIVRSRPYRQSYFKRIPCGSPPFVTVPCPKMDLVRHPVFSRSIALLRECGVHILHEPAHIEGR